jgi:hypothetical protein
VFYFGARALTVCVTPPVSRSVAVTNLGSVFETRPQTKLLSPFQGAPPSPNRDVKLNLTLLPLWIAEAMPIVPPPPPPPPPPVMTNADPNGLSIDGSLRL